MSLNIRWLTNGEKSVYMVRDAVAETVTIYDKIDEIPDSIRHYAGKIKQPKFVEPMGAKFWGVQAELYPEWPKTCGHPDFTGQNCIAEDCIYGGRNKGYEKCQYFGKEG